MCVCVREREKGFVVEKLKIEWGLEAGMMDGC